MFDSYNILNLRISVSLDSIIPLAWLRSPASCLLLLNCSSSLFINCLHLPSAFLSSLAQSSATLPFLSRTEGRSFWLNWPLLMILGCTGALRPVEFLTAKDSYFSLRVDRSDSRFLIKVSLEFNINLRSEFSWSSLLIETRDLFELRSLSSFIRMIS